MTILNGVANWLLTGVMVFSAPAQTGSSSNPAPYTMQVNSHVVLTDVTVTDNLGNPVTGLTNSDFLILDNKKPQKLSSFEEHRQQIASFREASATPGSFSNDYLRHPPAQVNVLLFDTTTINIEDQMFLFQQMKQFMNHLPAGEPFAVFARAGDMTVELTSFTDDHAKLIAAIQKAIPRLRLPSARAASDLDTLQQIAMYLSQVPGRKNIVWFTGGSNMLLGPNPMWIAMDPQARRAIYDLLEAERICIYPIDARGLTTAVGLAGLAIATQHSQMQQDAGATGGAAFVDTNGLATATQHILATDGDYYTLSYAANDQKGNGKWHRVEVKLSRPGYRLSYRQGYFDDKSTGQQTAPARGPIAKTRTMLRPGGNKLEVANDRSEPIVFSVEITPGSPTATIEPVDTPLKHGQSRYVVHYHVPAREVFASKVKGDTGTDEVGTAVLAYDRDGGLVAHKALRFTFDVDESKVTSLPNASLHFNQTLNLPAGQTYLYLAVWDMTTGRLGTMTADVEVKKPSTIAGNR
jgi:VWFA-related protein